MEVQDFPEPPAASLMEDLAGNSLTRLFEQEEGVVRAVPRLRCSLEIR